MKTPDFLLSPSAIREQLLSLAKADSDGTDTDRRAREYYASPSADMIWVDHYGVDQRADTLLRWLHTVGEIGFSEQAFSVPAIEADLRRMRTLDFESPAHTASQVAARLEYHLTKACLRYAYGQRFGYVNPYRAFNHLDIEKEDTLRHITKYRQLFDVAMDLPDKDYHRQVLHAVKCDSLSALLQQIQPRDAFFLKLCAMLPQAASDEQRRRIVCNMERQRWRRHHRMDEGKRVVVNIPSYHLYAFDADTIVDMRVACGAVRTKTPLLSSTIQWMEVNPQWVIPMSIIEKDVARHAGDSAYFARNRYNIFERATNQQMPIAAVSRQMLLSGKYRVAQESGSDNSLGRIVFRFPNSFQVFLHYTSSPSVFLRESRAVSHGCVRVAKPFELARFLLDHPDEWLLDRIRISMDLPPETERGIGYVRTHDADDRKLIGYVPVSPHVPVHIIYNTLWPDAGGILQTWPDVYGYDDILWKELQPYLP